MFLVLNSSICSRDESVRVDQGLMAIKEYSTLSKLPDWSITIRWFRIISWTLVKSLTSRQRFTCQVLRLLQTRQYTVSDSNSCLDEIQVHILGEANINQILTINKMKLLYYSDRSHFLQWDVLLRDLYFRLRLTQYIAPFSLKTRTNLTKGLWKVLMMPREIFFIILKFVEKLFKATPK